VERLPAGTRALELAPEAAAPGSTVWAVGNAGMADKPLNAGTLWRGRSGTVKKAFFWRVTLTGSEQRLETRGPATHSGTKPGDSGGPMVDDKGRLVGVTSSSNDQGDYAIDLSEVRTFLARAVPGTNQPRRAHRAVGTWTVTWRYKDRDNYAGLTLNADGT